MVRRGIYIVNETQLDEGQAQSVQTCFSDNVLPELEPILLLSQRQAEAVRFVYDSAMPDRLLEYLAKPLSPIHVPRLEGPGSIFKKIRQRDVLLYYPYHPFDYIINFVKTAALDPDVTQIKICLYRVAKNSRICDALINAVQNGKRVLDAEQVNKRVAAGKSVKIRAQESIHRYLSTGKLPRYPQSAMRRLARRRSKGKPK